MLAEDAAGVTDVVAAARQVGLNIDHDEAAALRDSDECMRNVYRECARYLVALWGRNNPRPARLPTGSINLDGIEELLSRDDVLSLAEAGVLDESIAMSLSLRHLDLLRTRSSCPRLDPLPLNLLSFRQILSISDEDFQRADELLRSFQEETDTRKRERQIGGAPYIIPRGDRFDGLRAHLDQNLPVNFGDTVNLFKTALLTEPRQAQTGEGGRSRGPSSQLRKNQRDRDLVGAVGEYHVNRLLSKTLGVDFRPDCWKSMNRRHFLPGNGGDDGLGYDFSFFREGIEWQVEVKSSEGEPGFFELSPNEVSTAQSAARKKSTIYEIIIVSNALSKEPGFTVVGNPYEKKVKKNFRIDEGGARIYFRVATEKTLDSK